MDYDKITQLVIGEYIELLDRRGAGYAYPWSGVLFSGHTLDEFRLLAHETISDPKSREFKNNQLSGLAFQTGFQLRPFMQELILEFQKIGVEILVVTASPAPLIQEFFRIYDFLGISDRDVIGMNHQIQKGMMMPQITFPFPYDQGKAELIQKRTTTIPFLACGDTQTDKGMMLYSKSGLLVDRGNQVMRSLADIHGWHILLEK